MGAELSALLTPEERREIADRNVTTEWRDYTEEQLQTRISIGRKAMEHMLCHDPTVTNEARAIYAKCPMWGFYKSAGAGDRALYRVYGVSWSDDEESVKAISAHFVCNNKVIGGVPVCDIMRVDRWTAEDLDFFREFVPTPGIFVDPLGFVLVIMGEYDSCRC